MNSSTAGPQALRKAGRKHCIGQPRYWPCCSACRDLHPQCCPPCCTHVQVVSFLGICCIPPCILTGGCEPQMLPLQLLQFISHRLLPRL